MNNLPCRCPNLLGGHSPHCESLIKFPNPPLICFSLLKQVHLRCSKWSPDVLQKKYEECETKGVNLWAGPFYFSGNLSEKEKKERAEKIRARHRSIGHGHDQEQALPKIVEEKAVGHGCMECYKPYLKGDLVIWVPVQS